MYTQKKSGNRFLQLRTCDRDDGFGRKSHPSGGEQTGYGISSMSYGLNYCHDTIVGYINKNEKRKRFRSAAHNKKTVGGSGEKSMKHRLPEAEDEA
jgi:hypothetical protein